MNTEKKLYQWDTGQKLEGCTGLYVDFPIDDEVYRVEAIDGMCIIPDELLQTSGSHKVYECMTNNTIRSFAFSVTPRPKPPDYVYTPTERLTFEGLVQKVDDAVADMIRKAESGEFDGYTPVKGKDYFTTAEIQQIQNEVSSGAIGEFKSVVDTETETFNTNAETKLNAYNQNNSQKINTYNTNATEKLNAYNTNANNRVAEFDSHTEQIQTDISELKSDLDSKLDKVIGKNLINTSNVTYGKHVNISNKKIQNNLSSYDFYCISDYIEVDQTKPYSLSLNSYSASIGVLYVDSNKNTIDVESNATIMSNNYNLTIPSGTKYVVLTLDYVHGDLDVCQLEQSDVITSYEKYNEVSSYDIVEDIKRNKDKIDNIRMKYTYIPQTAESESMESGSVLSIDASNSKCNNVITFVANISTFGKITLSCGKREGYYGAWIEIDSETVKVYKWNTNDVLLETISHGLNVTNEIKVIVKALDNNKATLIVSTVSGTYTKEIDWQCGRGAVKAEVESGSYTNCVLSFYVGDYKKKIWAFGDSYFDKWAFLLKGYGFNNLMLDGYSGRSSQKAYESFVKCISFATPIKVIWCLGMNDADSDTEINSSWKTCFEAVKKYCDNNDIEFIAQTIPSTPTKNHSFKNEYIRTTGCRIVDIEKAVGSDISTSWYNGLLSADNVHPTELGSDVIANTFICSFPEIMNLTN